MLHSHRRDADRLLPVDPTLRDLARDLYDRVADAAIISPHGHVPASVLLENAAFRNPTELLVVDDHYLTRLLHAAGIDLDTLGLGSTSVDPRSAWRTVAQNWHLFDGTATGYWIEEELAGVFGIHQQLDAASADAVYDQISALLASDQYRPRALYSRFGIEVLATTDDPLDDLDAHAALQRAGFRVIPTFRPDRYIDPDSIGFDGAVTRLLADAGTDATFAGYLQALEHRRQHFIAHGAVSADHGVIAPITAELSAHEAEALFSRVLGGRADGAERRLFAAHMLFQMARMSVADGLVMTVHAGVFRNHSSATLDRFGADSGHDIPVPTTFVEGLRPLLERFGLERDFHLVLFTVDETTYSREIAPLAGFYPSVYIGAPWWFLDAPDAIARFRSAVTETAGFSRGSGFIDDTRAFLSIPARHDTARRADASFLARLVGEGRMTRARAEQTIETLTVDLPRRVFKL